MNVLAQHWTGAINSDWNNAANWSDWPLNGEDVTIDPSLYSGMQASPALGGGSAFVPDRLFAENGAQVTIQGGLTISDRFIIGADAVVTMNSGNLITERLVLEAGGSFNLVSGTVNAFGVLALGDDGVQPSTFTQQGGTVNVSGEFGFDVELLPSTPTYRLVSGNLTVNGDAVWFGTGPGSGQGRLLVEGGNALVNGSIMNTVGSTVDLYIAITGGELYVNGPAMDLAHATDSLVQSTGNLVLDDALVLENDGVVRTTGGELIVYGDVELRGVGTTLFHNVTISTGAALQHTAPDEILVGGDWSIAGTFDAGSNTVAFVGNTAQQVDPTPFHGLRIDHSGTGVILGSGTTTVSGTLVLDNGHIVSSSSHMLQLLDNATSTAGSPASHVVGPMRKVGNDAFVFPVGTANSWRRIGIGACNDQDTEFTASFVDQGYSDTSTLDAGLASVSTIEHWTLERAVTSDEVQVELYWENATASGLSDCTGLAVAAWTGTAWVGSAGTTTGGCTGNDAGSIASNGDQPYYTVFALGTGDSTLVISEHDGTRLLPHPVPANDQVSLRLPDGSLEVSIHDGTGRRVAVLAAPGRGEQRVTLATAHLPSGQYVVQATGRSGLLGRDRLVVLH
ncbi:MAG: hypothetical protein KDB88_14495 [Flavobacteriales bacterium]|nr:hypothetical protein [Flavobacteriales bacterium]